VADLALRLIEHDLVERLRALDRGAGDGARARLRVALEVDAREVGREVVVLVLRPALERVVVALVAVEAGGEEQVSRVLHRLRRRAEDLVIAGGGILAIGARRGEDLARERVVRRVGGDFRPDPFAELAGAVLAEELPVHLQQVGPLVGPVVDVVRRADQAVDHGVAFLADRPRVGEERAHLLGRGRQARQVEVHAAQEIGVGAQLRRQDLQAAPLRRGELVDAVPLLGLAPLEAGAVAHDRHRRRSVGALESREQRRFTAAQGTHQTAVLDHGHVLVTRLDEALGGDIAPPAVGVGGDDLHLLAGTDALQHGVARADLDRGHAWRREVELRAAGDPGAQDAVVFVVVRGARAALVRHGAGGFQEHQ